MNDISKNNIFPTISKVNIKDTFILYNNFVKNAIKYQSAMTDLTTTVNDLAHSYEEFINYAPMKAIIESSGQQIDIYNSMKIYRILFESFKKMSEFLDRDFANPLNDDYKLMQEKFNDKKLEKTLKMEEKQRTKSLNPGVLPEPSPIQRSLFQQYTSAVDFVTHKTKKLQSYETHVFENMVQGMLTYENLYDNNSIYSVNRSLGRNNCTSNYDNNLYNNDEIIINEFKNDDVIFHPYLFNNVDNINKKNVYNNDVIENEIDNNINIGNNGSTYYFKRKNCHHRHTNSTPNIKYGDNTGDIPPSTITRSLERYHKDTPKFNYFSTYNDSHSYEYNYNESNPIEEDDKKETKLKLNIKSTLKNDLKKNFCEIKNKLHKRHSNSSPIISKPIPTQNNRHSALSDQEFIVPSKKKMNNLIKTGKVHSIDDIKKNKHSSMDSPIPDAKPEEKNIENNIEIPTEIKNNTMDNNTVPNSVMNETPKLVNENENIPVFVPPQLTQPMLKVPKPMNRHIRSSSYGGISQSHIRGMSSNLALKHFPSVLPKEYSTPMNPSHFQSNNSSPILRNETLSIDEDTAVLSKKSKSSYSIHDLLNNWPNIEELTPTYDNRPAFTRKNSLPIYNRKKLLTSSPVKFDFIPSHRSGTPNNDTSTKNRSVNWDNNNKEYIIPNNIKLEKPAEESSYDDFENTEYEESSMMINNLTRLIFSKFNSSPSNINDSEDDLQTPIASNSGRLTHIEKTNQYNEVEEAEPVLPIRGVSLFLNQPEEKNEIEPVMPIRGISLHVNEENYNTMDEMKQYNGDYITTDNYNNLEENINVKEKIEDDRVSIGKPHRKESKISIEDIPKRNSSITISSTRKKPDSTPFLSFPRKTSIDYNNKQTSNVSIDTHKTKLASTPIKNLKYEDEEDNEETPKIEKFPERPKFTKQECPNTPNAPVTPVIPNTKLCDILMNHEEPSPFNFNEHTGNDIIVISNPLAEVINNKNLAEFKDDLPDECHEFRICRNEEYMSFDVCSNDVDIKSAVGSIVDPEEDTSRLDILSNDNSFSSRNSNTSMVNEENSNILTTKKDNQSVIQGITEQQEEFNELHNNNVSMKKYVALYSYVARDNRELSFQRADIINVRKEQGEWAYGYKENLINDEEIQYGWVPKSYLKIIIVS